MGIKYDNTNNVQYSESFWDINGIKQYVLYYPQHESDKVLIHLHSGPGDVNSIYAPLFFPSDLPCSLLFYDQRGAGKTFLMNKLNKEDVTLSALVEDLYQLILKIKEEYKIPKVILVAHSFGSILGMEFINKHEDMIDGYIGISQIVDTKEAEKMNFDTLYSKITKIGYSDEDKKMIKALKDDNYPYIEDKEKYFYDCHILRYLSNSYHRSYIDMPRKRHLLKSYTVKFKDYKWINHFDRVTELNQNLIDIVAEYKLTYKNFTKPMFFISGETAYINPSSLVKDYLNEITCPLSGFYIVPNSSHLPQYENKSSYLKIIREIIGKIDEYEQNINNPKEEIDS